VVLAVLLLSTAWCIPHLEVSCADLNSNSIGTVACNTNSNNSHNSRGSINISTVLPLLRHRRLQLDHHNSFPHYSCGKMGHFTRECLMPKQRNSPSAPATVVNHQRGQQRGPTPRSGRANYSIMDEQYVACLVMHRPNHTGQHYVTEPPQK
jgi:hypothetical protein